MRPVIIAKNLIPSVHFEYDALMFYRGNILRVRHFSIICWLRVIDKLYQGRAVTSVYYLPQATNDNFHSYNRYGSRFCGRQ